MAINIDNVVLKTDFFVRPTDRQQCLESSSCHPFHCKKGIPYSQALRLSRICSDNFSFDRSSNDLKIWLIERGYNEKMIKKELFQARSNPREELLEKEPREKKQQSLTLNITYYPVFQCVKKMLKNLHILLTPDNRHKLIFDEFPAVCVKYDKSWKDCLVHSSIKFVT